MRSNEVIKEIGRLGWFASSVCGRWRFTGSTDAYVQCNVGTGRTPRGKVLYRIVARAGGFNVILLIGNQDPRVDKFKVEVEKQRVGNWFVDGRDAGVCEFVPEMGLVEDVVKRLAEAWDKFHSAYDSVLFASSKVNVPKEAPPLMATSNSNANCILLACELKTTANEFSTEISKWKGWGEYREYWDEFVKGWVDHKACPWDDISRAFYRTGRLDFDELPEPYLGAPETEKSQLDAVMININPGASQSNEVGNLEATKFFSRRNCGAWLLDKLIDDYGCKYSLYASPTDFSCLNPDLIKDVGTDREVCGVSWWQLPRRTPLPWLKQIYGHSVNPRKVFAAEFCPFHSARQGFSVNDFLRSGVPRRWFNDRVIIPCGRAALESKLPFVVGVGKIIVDCMEKLGYKRVCEWKKLCRNERSNRRYVCFDVDGVRFLLTYLDRGGSNWTPSPYFGTFEQSEIWKSLDYMPRSGS